MRRFEFRKLGGRVEFECVIILDFQMSWRVKQTLADCWSEWKSYKMSDRLSPNLLICLTAVAFDNQLEMFKLIICAFMCNAKRRESTLKTSPRLLFLIVLFSPSSDWWEDKGCLDHWTTSLSLDSKNIIADFNELVEVNLWWNGCLLCLCKVELRVRQCFQS